MAVFFTLSVMLGALALLLFYLPLWIQLNYQHRDRDDRLTVEVHTVARLLYYRFEVPVLRLSRERFFPALFVEAELQQGLGRKLLLQEKEAITAEDVLRVINWRSLRLAHRMIGEYARILDYVTRTTAIESLRWTTGFGLADPALTGFATGLLWTVKSVLYRRVRNMLRSPGRPQIAVEPFFGGPRLQVDFHCIFATRIGHIIIVGYKLRQVFKKGVNKDGGTSDSGADENSDGEH